MDGEEERFAAVGERLAERAESGEFSGTVLMTRAGEPVFRAAYGYADRANGLPNTPTTRFGLASLTKMFTAVAVADLVTSGRLDFDTRVVDLLPAERRPSTLLPEVTVHHLLSHTSGIADYCEEEEDSPAYLADYGQLWVDLPCYGIERPADFLPLFGDLAPYRPPSAQFQYSNAGYIVLGIVIEEVTGTPYATVVQERVFDRAGMASSGFFRLDEPVPEMATGYLPRATADAPWRTNIYSIPVVGGADGGAFSNVDDLDRFLRAYGDGTLLGPQQDLVLTPHTDAGNGFFEGYGVHLYPDGRYGHGGGDPGVEVIANRWPDEDVHIVVLCNVEGEISIDARNQVVEAWRG